MPVSIRIWPDGKSLKTDEGTLLLKILRENNLVVDAPCGGHGTCGKCRVLVNGEERLACQTIVDRDMTVVLPDVEGTAILQQGTCIETVADGADRYALAIDIGTTTVVVSLLDGQSGLVLAQASCLNPQTQYGADVISRIQYVLENGSEELQKSIISTLHTLIEEAAKKADISPIEITVAAVVGNTAMHHLLLGIDPKPLTVPPYMPAVCEAMERMTGNISVRILPNIAGFVGADTVGCMAATRFDQFEELTLLIDIGTNGEMVLGRKERRVACSTAAGPAFEGAKISCGMRGADGAIDHVWLEDGNIRWSVIGSGNAKGLCGSGLLDLVAVLLETGEISENGYMECKEYRLGDTGVSLTQKDVREVQLAKAAIRAGIELMCDYMGVEVAEIETVLLAGAFGNYMAPSSACKIGMIPECLLDRIEPIGNAAAEGAKMSALSKAEFRYSQSLASGTEFLELASLTDFQDRYVDCLSFGVLDDD